MKLTHHEVETSLQERTREVELLKSRAILVHSFDTSMNNRIDELRSEFRTISKDFELEKDCGNFVISMFIAKC